MHISKLDVYRQEWLELVFDDRNKAYGAYDLRKNYSVNMAKAMGITFGSIAVLFIVCGFLIKHTPVAEIIKVVPVTLDRIIIAHPLKADPPKPVTHQPPKPAVQVATTRDLPLVAVPDNKAENPPTTETLVNTVIGQSNLKGIDGPANAPVQPAGTGSGNPGPASTGNEIVSTDVLEVMPEPFGGATAWSRFLQKNIHYPAQAAEAGVQGKVWLSFVIEKDGRLSNIVVEKGVGHGLDEEALRVLKLAPAWKPGIQNGQHVRVKYTIPINFVMPEE
jgi:protein TonB